MQGNSSVFLRLWGKSDEIGSQESGDDPQSEQDSAYFSHNQSRADDELSGIEESQRKRLSRTPSSLSPSCPILRKDVGPEYVSTIKKNITLLLPDTRAGGRPCGVHLQTEDAQLNNQKIHTDSRTGSVHHQLTQFKKEARTNLLHTLTPKSWPNINLLFGDWKDSELYRHLSSLSSVQVADLLLGLQETIFSEHVNRTDLLLFAIINLFHKTSCVLTCRGYAAGLKPEAWKRLQGDCSNFFYSDPRGYWGKTRNLFLDLWVGLLLGD